MDADEYNKNVMELVKQIVSTFPDSKWEVELDPTYEVIGGEDLNLHGKIDIKSIKIFGTQPAESGTQQSGTTDVLSG